MADQPTTKSRDSLRSELNHLSFTLRFDPGKRASFKLSKNVAHFSWTEDGVEVHRRVLLSNPPDVLLHGNQEHDASPLSNKPPGEDVWWLPFDSLLSLGRLSRMQDYQHSLLSEYDAKCFHLFVSHRWLTPTDPDPDGLQAALLTWQIVGHLVEAIWVTAARGRYTARKTLPPRSRGFVGVYGNEFSEAIVVNVLRSISNSDFEDLIKEAESFGDLEDLGVSQARSDAGLRVLQRRLGATPRIQTVLRRFRFWYDYACMPQAPRTPTEQQRFEALLPKLGSIQSAGRTLVLLDDPLDYLSRAWCTYEAVWGSAYLRNTLDILEGASAPYQEFATRCDRLESMLMDRTAIVWRAILDTELFGIQAPSVCMERLGLQSTEPQDMETVYTLLRGMGPSPNSRFDPTSVVTGTYPVALQSGSGFIVAIHGASEGEQSGEVTTLHLDDSWSRIIDAGIPPSFECYPKAPDEEKPTAHLAIFGPCEGEAILDADFLRRHRGLLERHFGVTVRSSSWLASDIAPVGTLPVGDLAISGIDADVWIIAGSNHFLKSYPALLLIESLRALGIDFISLIPNRSTHNAIRFSCSTKDSDRELIPLEPDHSPFGIYEGGLFQAQLAQKLGVQW